MRVLTLPRVSLTFVRHASFSTGLKTLSLGNRRTQEFRTFFYRDGIKISPWHDLRLHPTLDDKIVNFVNEIPKNTDAKMEISTAEPLNPIRQDLKNGKLRYFKYGKIPFNYGAIPQTWEDPEHVSLRTGFPGDNDPLDAIELSAEPLPYASVTPCKVLGILGLIDQGETDWKLLVISAENLVAEGLNEAEQIEKTLMAQVIDWFENYKVAEGKAKNTFAFDGKAQDSEFANEIIKETHEAWQRKWNFTGRYNAK